MKDTPENRAALAKAERAIELNSELSAARAAYYISGQPTMSDQEYDAKERELAELAKNDSYIKDIASVLTTVGSDLQDDSNRYKHSSPMLSIENKYLVEEVEEWFDSLPAGSTVVIEPKIDGLSLALRYSDRKLVLALTRGDGEVGEDVTAQVYATPLIPKTLSPKFPETAVEIRGECFMSVNKFDELNVELEKNGGKKFASPRNLAAGSLKLKDLGEVKKRDLNFHPWQVIGLDPDPLGVSKDLEFLHRNSEFGKPSWRQPILVKIRSKQELAKAIQSLGEMREKMWHKALGMPTDGIVFKVEERKGRWAMGSGTKFPKWCCCYKYQTQDGETTLLDVVWQTGRLGTVTPVGILEPVNLGGAMTSRVTLNNMTFIKEMGLDYGDRIALKRSGDVIPLITGIAKKAEKSNPVKPPTNCWDCGEPVEEYIDPRSNITTWLCVNRKCGGMLKAHLVYIGQRTLLDIEGLGPQLAEKFVEEGVVEDIGDLYLWSRDLEKKIAKFGEDKVSDAIYDSGWPVVQTMELNRGLQGSKNNGWDKWLAALGIPGVGAVLAKNIATHLALQPDDMASIPTLLKKLDEEGNYLEGIGAKKLEAIMAWCNDPIATEICRKLSEAGVQPKATFKPKALAGSSAPLSGELICVTGEFSELGDREYLQAILASLGAQIKGVSKKLTILVAGDGAGPSKLQKARELGIRLEDRIWLTKVFKDNNIQAKPKFDTEEIEDL